MKNNRVLITGGAGFIGVAVAKLLVAEGCSVLLFDNLTCPRYSRCRARRWT